MFRVPFAWLSGPSLVLVTALGCAPAPSAGSPAPSQPPSDTPNTATAAREATLYPELKTYLDALDPTLDELDQERREILAQLATYVREQHASGQPARLLFICTHNSRRSHMGQLWAAAAAAYYGVDAIETYSGGTEATAFNPRAVAAMERAGFVIEAPEGEMDNPRYAVRLANEAPTMAAFSKTWQHEVNPDEGFAAVMTCSQADEACPFVRGAALRVALPYDDPKVADGTPEEGTRYDERARQIATEMLYLFRLLAAGE